MFTSAKRRARRKLRWLDTLVRCDVDMVELFLIRWALAAGWRCLQGLVDLNLLGANKTTVHRVLHSSRSLRAVRISIDGFGCQNRVKFV